MQNADPSVVGSGGKFEQGAAAWDHLLSPSSPATWRHLGSKALQGKRILITGAGGSIGSALAHAAAASQVASLILLDSSENGLYQIDRSLQQAAGPQRIAVLGSVCDAVLLEHMMSEHEPEIILHAAALKHVPLMEQNPFAAIENNVFGTHTLARAAAGHRVQQIVVVSTDKAVEPHSIMGASKRIAELILPGLGISTQVKVVRLCNVMGSQGSVLPLFLEQIAQGVPLTVTHPEAQRYFLPLDDAVRAVLDALLAPATPVLLLPRIGAALRIVDLARQLLAFHGSSASIEYTGLRPGDKLAEKLIADTEALDFGTESERAGLQIVHSLAPAPVAWEAALETLRHAIERRDLRELLRGVHSLVPEYQPSDVILSALRAQQTPTVVEEMRV